MNMWNFLNCHDFFHWQLVFFTCFSHFYFCSSWRPWLQLNDEQKAQWHSCSLHTSKHFTSKSHRTLRNGTWKHVWMLLSEVRWGEVGETCILQCHCPASVPCPSLSYSQNSYLLMNSRNEWVHSDGKYSAGGETEILRIFSIIVFGFFFFSH
jgi:hypothetical protein